MPQVPKGCSSNDSARSWRKKRSSARESARFRPAAYLAASPSFVLSSLPPTVSGCAHFLSNRPSEPGAMNPGHGLHSLLSNDPQTVPSTLRSGPPTTTSIAARTSQSPNRSAWQDQSHDRARDRGRPAPPRVAFVRAAYIARELGDEYTLTRLQQRYLRVALLIVDQLGFVPFERAGDELPSNLFADCSERRSAIVITNLAFSEWVQVFGDEKRTTTLFDRLGHHAHILTTCDQSYRTCGRTTSCAEAKPTTTRPLPATQVDHLFTDVVDHFPSDDDCRR